MYCVCDGHNRATAPSWASKRTSLLDTKITDTFVSLTISHISDTIQLEHVAHMVIMLLSSNNMSSVAGNWN